MKVSVGEVYAKTQVIPKDLNPDWSRVFAFSKDKLHGQFLEISVWDAVRNVTFTLWSAFAALIDRVVFKLQAVRLSNEHSAYRFLG